jgi:hypothetical protein
MNGRGLGVIEFLDALSNGRPHVPTPQSGSKLSRPSKRLNGQRTPHSRWPSYLRTLTRVPSPKLTKRTHSLRRLQGIATPGVQCAVCHRRTSCAWDRWPGPGR